MCVCAGVCMWVSIGDSRGQRHWIPGAGVADGCEPPDLGSENQTCVFYRKASALNCWAISIAPQGLLLKCIPFTGPQIFIILYNLFTTLILLNIRVPYWCYSILELVIGCLRRWWPSCLMTDFNLAVCVLVPCYFRLSSSPWRIYMKVLMSSGHLWNIKYGSSLLLVLQISILNKLLLVR